MSDAANGEKKEPLDVYQLIMAMTQEMASVAWQKMGLQPDMMSGTIEKDLAQAKAAIDATTALGGVFNGGRKGRKVAQRTQRKASAWTGLGQSCLIA